MSIRMRFPAIDGSVSYEWRFTCNQRGATWRERLAYFLRQMAMRLDGKLCLAIAMTSTPELTVRQQIDILNHGTADMERMLVDTVRAEAQEQLLRRERPELYESEAR